MTWLAMSWTNLVQIGPRPFQNTHSGILAPLKTDEKALLNRQLEDVLIAIMMHCNARLLDVQPVIFRFNWHARANSEVGQHYALQTYSILLLMRYAML